jgi:resuscitation-promoting factor RpfE
MNPVPCGRRGVSPGEAIRPPTVEPDREGTTQTIRLPRQAPASAQCGAVGARVAKGQKLKNIRKTFGLATIAGALVVAPMTALTVGAGTANADGVNWDAVAACESGGNWHTATGNGYYGGLQFTMSTWHANGGSGSPHQASRDEQIRVANNVLKSQGIRAWPVCGRRG